MSFVLFYLFLFLLTSRYEWESSLLEERWLEGIYNVGTPPQLKPAPVESHGLYVRDGL